MNGRSAGGLVLLLVGSLALIGYLTGNLDRWLGALFTPPTGAGTSTSSASAHPATMTAPAGGNHRGAIA